MCVSINGPILSDEWINTLLLAASEAVEDCRREQPDYEAFAERRDRWNDTLTGLGGALLGEYDGAVNQAFIDYQAILENDAIVRGLSEGMGARPLGETVPGLKEAEERLQEVCRQFTGRLDGEAGVQCAEYLQARKQRIDDGRALCRRCGGELAEGLLRRSGSEPARP